MFCEELRVERLVVPIVLSSRVDTAAAFSIELILFFSLGDAIFTPENEEVNDNAHEGRHDHNVLQHFP